jgi:hypothetical protein
LATVQTPVPKLQIRRQTRKWRGDKPAIYKTIGSYLMTPRVRCPTLSTQQLHTRNKFAASADTTCGAGGFAARVGRSDRGDVQGYHRLHFRLQRVQVHDVGVVVSSLRRLA